MQIDFRRRLPADHRPFGQEPDLGAFFRQLDRGERSRHIRHFVDDQHLARGLGLVERDLVPRQAIAGLPAGDRLAGLALDCLLYTSRCV